jgi:hypothetical protein
MNIEAILALVFAAIALGGLLLMLGDYRYLIQRIKRLNLNIGYIFPLLVACMVVIGVISIFGYYYMPISDSGCEHYQEFRSVLTPNGQAIGCEFNGTAWHFNATLVNLTFHEVKEYVI